MYRIAKIYKTIQGEGHHAGNSCVIVRLSGCNLWSGLEKDRDRAVCKFCDTDFIHKESLSPGEIKNRVDSLLPAAFILLTGGEPALQWDAELAETLSGTGIPVHMETNGTVPLAARQPDWVTVSPKLPRSSLRVEQADELKLVYPQVGIDPGDFADIAQLRTLQPLWGDMSSTEACVKFILENPGWSLSLQTNKFLSIP